MDVFDKETRSRNMAAIKGQNTRPEMIVRHYLHSKGFRYRLHSRNLPGKPDLTMPKFNAVVFVHGCFWHRHNRCRFATMPSSNTEFWGKKLTGNKERDKARKTDLRKLGWRVLTVWECGLRSSRNRERNLEKIKSWLLSEKKTGAIPAK